MKILPSIRSTTSSRYLFRNERRALHPPLVAFMQNKFPLVGMQVLTDAEGLFYDDLMGIYRNRIDDCKLYIHYMLRTSNSGIMQDMYFNSLVGNFSCD